MEAVMRFRVRVLLALVLLFTSLAVGKDKNKKKIILPGDVLQARTVMVVVSPEAGIPLTDPRGNRIARMDVENALSKWGRLVPTPDVTTADLVIAVRKGSGKMVTPTISGGPSNNPPVIVGPGSEGSVWSTGGRVGRAPDLTNPGLGPQDTTPHPSAEIGPSGDIFEVYRGRVEYPLDNAPVWRYLAKDALRSPDVPAVEAFRKLIEEAEKQQQKGP
jgi:hypothetical protein